MGAVGEEEHGFLLGIGWGREHGVMSGGMETKQDLAARRSFHAQALRADGHTAIAADFDEGAHAPHIIPPRATRRWPHDGTLLFPGLIPSPLRSLAQFAMDFVGVAMDSQLVDVRIGDGDFGDLFAGEVGRQTPLPELMFAFDFAFGLRGGGVEETDVIEFEGPAQLRERVGIMRAKDAVVIDVDLERASVGQESGRKEIEVGKQEFALVEFRARKEAAAIIEHVEHGESQFGVREPAVG